MSARSYNQICGLAQSLDLLGERWTLLIVRELLLGPKRFGALREALPGVNANLLSARIKSLTEAGIVEPIELPPPAAGVSAYALTERGEGLREPLLSLALWGMDLLEPAEQHSRGWTSRGSWLASTRVAAAERAGVLAGLPPLTLNARVDGERFMIETDGSGSGLVRHGAADDAGAQLEAGMARFHALLTGAAELDPEGERDAAAAAPLIAALAATAEPTGVPAPARAA